MANMDNVDTGSGHGGKTSERRMQNHADAMDSLQATMASAGFVSLVAKGSVASVPAS